jgi:putative Holliday junction resolvase
MDGSVPGKLLALDVGLARIGVATCDPLQLAAHPLTTIHRTSRRDDFLSLANLVETEAVGAVICGLPLHMDGSESAQTRTTRKWALRLAHALRALLGQPIPVIYWDERLSTFAAREILSEYGEPCEEDAAAAAVILQSYLDAQKTKNTLDYGRIDLPPKSTE